MVRFPFLDGGHPAQAPGVAFGKGSVPRAAAAADIRGPGAAWQQNLSALRPSRFARRKVAIFPKPPDFGFLAVHRVWVWI